MSSYNKNTSNNSGITVDNLQVNKNFTAPNGGEYVDKSSAQTIDGQKTFTATLITNQISVQPGANFNMGGSTSTLSITGTSYLRGNVNIGNPALTTALQINSPTTLGSVISPTDLLVNGSTTSNNYNLNPTTFTGTCTSSGTSLTVISSSGTPSIGQLIYGTITSQAGSSIALATYQSITGSITGTTMTLISTPGISIVGFFVSGTNVLSETYVVSGSGTTWVVNMTQTVASTNLNLSRSILTLGSSNSLVGIGQLVSGLNVVANTRIISGSGLSWVVDLYQTVASGMLTFSIPPNTRITAGTTSPYTISNNATTLGTTTLLNNLTIPVGALINFYALPSTTGLNNRYFGTNLYYNYQPVCLTANTLQIFNVAQINNLPIGFYQVYGQVFLSNMLVAGDATYACNISISTQSQTINSSIQNSPIAFNNFPAEMAIRQGAIQISGVFFNTSIQNLYLVIQFQTYLAVVQIISSNTFLNAVRIG